MTRDEAIANAIECATDADHGIGSGTMSPERVEATVRIAEVWLRIADRRPAGETAVQFGTGAQLDGGLP